MKRTDQETEVCQVYATLHIERNNQETEVCQFFCFYLNNFTFDNIKVKKSCNTSIFRYLTLLLIMNSNVSFTPNTALQYESKN